MAAFVRFNALKILFTPALDFAIVFPGLLVPICARLNVLSANWPTRRWQRTNETENKAGWLKSELGRQSKAAKVKKVRAVQDDQLAATPVFVRFSRNSKPMAKARCSVLT